MSGIEFESFSENSFLSSDGSLPPLDEISRLDPGRARP